MTLLRLVTWRAVLLTQGLAVLFALAPWLESWNAPDQPSLAHRLLEQCMGALLVMLATFAADEYVRRGWPLLRAFATLFLAACLATSLLVLAIGGRAQGGPLDVLAGLSSTFFGVGAYWGTPVLVYLNRQSAARLLATVEKSELRRAQTERSLIESELAAAQAQIDPATVLEQLSGLRDRYAMNDAGADHELERLIADLRETVARCGRVLPGAPA